MWNNKSIWIVTFFLLLACSQVLADWQVQDSCIVGTNCPLVRPVVDENGTLLPGAVCKATIHNSTSAIVTNATMTDQGTGFYNYTFRTNSSGYYPSVIQCTYAGRNSVGELSFTVQQELFSGMGFEIAIPMIFVFFGITGLFMARHFNNEKTQGLTSITIQHSFWLLACVFFLVAFQSINLIVEAENGAGNAVLGRLAGLTSTVYIAVLWITVGIVFFIGVSFAMSSITLIRNRQSNKRNKDENLYEDFVPDEGEI